MPPPPPTSRLEFRRWTSADLPLAQSLWGDPAVMRFLGGPYSDDEVHARLAREAANDAEHGVQYWPLFLRDGGAFAGCCGLKPHEPEHGFFEIGFHFLPHCWGGGLASEAAQAVIAFARDTMKMRALFAGHHPDNGASGALLRKLGFTQLGTHFFARTALDHPWYRLDLDSAVSDAAASR